MLNVVVDLFFSTWHFQTAYTNVNERLIPFWGTKYHSLKIHFWCCTKNGTDDNDNQFGLQYVKYFIGHCFFSKQFISISKKFELLKECVKIIISLFCPKYTFYRFLMPNSINRQREDKKKTKATVSTRLTLQLESVFLSGQRTIM